MNELLALAGTWDRASATYLARANRLGNCRAGEVAAAEAGTLKGCADDLRKAIVAITGAGFPRSGAPDSPDRNGAFDGFQVTSDADPGL